MPKTEADSALAVLLPWASLVCLAAAVLVGVTGGFTLRAGGLTLSVHRPWILAAAALAGLGIAHLPSRYVATRRVMQRAWQALEGAAGWCAAGVALAVIVAGLAWGAFTAGAADQYGYVSQAHLWAQRELIQAEPLAAAAPWPNAELTLTPFGYRPGPVNGTIVPTYPPGLPLMMSAAILAFGPAAAFWVVPILGGLGILLAYRTGRVLFGPVAALLATAWLASSPIVLFQLMQPMSDVPAMTASIAAVYLALRPGPSTGLPAGLAMSCAVLVRPNLALLAIPVGVLLLLAPARERQSRATLLLTFGLGLLPGVLLLGWTQATLYGSCWRSGYGNVGPLFRFKARRLCRNLGDYASWLLLSSTALAFLAPLAIFLKGRRVLVSVLLFCIAAGALPYAFYRPFESWTYLRFLLPVLPLVLILSCGLCGGLSGRLTPSVRLSVLLALGVFLVGGGLGRARALGVFALKDVERRYQEVGGYVSRALPERAALIALQQAGGLRFYGRRQSVRWDWIDPAWLDRAVAWLERRGHPVYLVFDGDEETAFRRRFGQGSALARREWCLTAARPRWPRVRIYAVGDCAPAGRSGPVALIP